MILTASNTPFLPDSFSQHKVEYSFCSPGICDSNGGAAYSLMRLEIQYRSFRLWPVLGGSYAIASSRQDKAVHPVLTPAQLKSGPSRGAPPQKAG